MHDTVNRTWLVVARAMFNEERAYLAAELLPSVRYVTLTALLAATTAGSASTPLAKLGNNAVYRAVLRFTMSRLLQLGANLTIEFGCNGDGTGARLRASAA